jgi:hypothetical protein
LLIPYVIPKLVLAIIVFVVIITLFISQINKGTTTSETVNKLIGAKLFTQDCLEGDTLDYTCATPDSDLYPEFSAEDPPGVNWDGCPADFLYITNLKGCEPEKAVEGTDEVAYCCTRVRPSTCYLEGLRTCYRAEMIEQFGVCPGLQFPYNDHCTADCSQEGCEFYNEETGKPGANCTAQPGCCGKTDNRLCVLDCPPDYSQVVPNPYDPATEDAKFREWDCGSATILQNEICCQRTE